MKKSFFVAMQAALAVSLTIFAFTLQAQGIDSAVMKYGATYQQEKVYLHYDKAAYAPGETIWFKAYLLQGLFPVTESKTLYTDWIDDNGTVLHHTVSPIVDGGVTNGQFEIPETFEGNAIHVRAYTKW